MKIATIVVVLLIFLCPAVAPATPELSAEQRQRLGEHEIVLLDILPPGGQAGVGQGGTAVALVRANAADIWRVLVDYAGHSGLYPRVVDATVLEAGADHALVRYVVGVGPFSFAFYVDNFADRARGRLAWQLARGRRNDLFRDSWGYWEVQPVADGALLTYAMAARTMLPTFLTRGAERDGLVQTLQAVRNRAEHTR